MEKTDKLATLGTQITRQRQTKQKAQYVLDINVRKQTQIM
jgi:hypothetical protein